MEDGFIKMDLGNVFGGSREEGGADWELAGSLTGA